MSESGYKDFEWENSLELKKALKLVLKYEIHCLLRRLSETGEESVVITASAAEGSASHLCSKKGEDFLQIENLEAVKHNFLSYCKVVSEPSLSKRPRLETFTPPSRAAPKEQSEVSPREQSSEEITIIEPVSIKSEPVDLDLDLDLQVSELTECPQPQEQKNMPSVSHESSQAHRVVVTFDVPNKRYRIQNLLKERHMTTQAVSRNNTEDTHFQFDDCNQLKETDAKSLTSQAYSSQNFELPQKSPFIRTTSILGSSQFTEQKDQLDMFSYSQAETPQDTHFYRSITTGKSEHLGNRKTVGLSGAKFQSEKKALKFCDFPENLRETTDVFDKTNARDTSAGSKPTDIRNTDATSILHRHYRINDFLDEGMFHPLESKSEVENQRQTDSGIAHFSEPVSEKSDSTLLMNSQVIIGFEEGRSETQQYRFGHRIFTEETAFTESGGCQQAVSRQSSYSSNLIDQPYTVGLTNTGDTLISLPVRNFDFVVDKDQPKNHFGEMESRSTGTRRFRSSIEQRSFRMTIQNTEEFVGQKELLESVNPNDSTGYHSKKQVFMEGTWSGREDSDSHLKSEVDDIASVDTTDGLSLSEPERPTADSREFSKSFTIQQSDAAATQTMLDLQADLCVADIAHVNNSLNNLEALQSLSQRTFSSNTVILRNESIPTGLPFNASQNSINRATLNRHYGRSRTDYSKVTSGRYLCPYCPAKDFRDRRTLQRHIRKHTGEKPFHCSICGRGLGDSRSLFEHVQLHTGNLPYKCKLCGKAFRHHNTFNAHKKKHFT